jgi:hypothetical protein
MALVALRRTGQCEFTVPEALFDLDYPGHYFRRTKYVSVTVPCVVSPYVPVNATLTLLRHHIRVRPDLPGGTYVGDPTTDTRFRSSVGAIQSVVTSGGSDDAGVFEVNLRDERYLPFEGSGAIATWRIELPAEFRQFDYDTIADVILQLRYTAREGGQAMRTAAVDALRDQVTSLLGAAHDGGDPALAQVFSARHEFPDAWRAFVGGSGADAVLTLPVGPDRFPFLFAGRILTVTGTKVVVTVHSGHSGAAIPARLTAPSGSDGRDLRPAPTLGGSPAADFDVPDVTVAPGQAWTVTIARADLPADLDDVYLGLRYSVTQPPVR